MTDTVFSDISEWQDYVNDDYPYEFIVLRSNDGTYRDRKFQRNLAWAKDAVDRGKLRGFGVYFVIRPNWEQSVETCMDQIGEPHPLMAIMIDIESWNGAMSGDYSGACNAARERLIGWLGGNRRRVFGYGNRYDLQSMWPDRGDARVIVAAYDMAPPSDVPGFIAHQFTSSASTPPWGNARTDLNAANGYDIDSWLAELGLAGGGLHPDSDPAVPAGPGVDVEDLAQRVLRGEFGDGDDRRSALGPNYDIVQARVEELVAAPAPKSDEQLADEVLAGVYGDGDARRANLGDRYDAVQAIVEQRVSTPARRQIDTYTVQAGDNLTNIAKRYPQDDVTAKSIAGDNGIGNINAIQAGWDLAIFSEQ